MTINVPACVQRLGDEFVEFVPLNAVNWDACMIEPELHSVPKHRKCTPRLLRCESQIRRIKVDDIR